jgi:calcineurin-like phosphoesterase family protein
MTVWYTSDLHFGHAKVAEQRGYHSTIDHDGRIADIWNSMVRPDDIVYVLGDVALSSHSAARVASLNGHKRLISGNHDASHPMHRNAHTGVLKMLDAGFESVQAHGRRRSQGVEFLMSHHPYEGDHTAEDRQVQWRLRDMGVPLVHGHVHSQDLVTTLTSIGTRQVHVGWDAWLHPVPEETVIIFIRSQI